ncbi:MAG: hypothetical protein J1E56_05890 [Ruminococcus sp.]|nr:hypothetical protein [Ruminococcus sp.]
MSKRKKKRKKSVDVKNTKRKKSYKKQIIGLVIGFLLVTAIVVVAIVFSRNPNADLIDKTWVSYKAYNSSNKEVELSAVYNNRYTNYQGRLLFNNDGTFEIWLTVGDANDGTHKGTYTYNGEVINVQYSSGEEAEFQVSKDESGKILYIVAPYTNDYDTYSVYFN